MIRTIKTRDEFKTIYNTLSSRPDGLSSFTMPLLIRKTGDLHDATLLKEVLDTYLSSHSYDSAVVELSLIHI